MVPKLPFTEDDLKRAASPMSYARALGYLDKVEDLEIAGAWVAATVIGSDVYTIRLTFGNATAGIRGSCSCPFGAEGNFCKHCVATGLVALSSGDSIASRPGSAPVVASEPAGGQSEDVVSWLCSLSREQLLAEVLALAAHDPDIWHRLARRATAMGTAVDDVRGAIETLIWVTDYVDYDEAPYYANDILRAANLITEVIEAGAAAEAIGLARDAIGWLRQCLSTVDDSDGDVGNAGFELLHVHLLACRAAPPDPAELARYLCDLYLTDEWGLVPALTSYASVLGGAGMSALRERVAAAYEASPDDRRARGMMESVIEAEGDVDALIAFYATNLDEFGWQHLRIVNKLDEVGRTDEALDWAERGVRSGPRPDARLVAYLTGRYTTAGRAGDVVSLRQMLFAAEHTLANFRALRDAALAAGTWDTVRSACFAFLRKDALAVGGSTLWSPWAGPVLIDALIDDGDLMGAWDAAGDIASQPQWVRLADASLGVRPADALAVYVKVIERLTLRTGDDVYRQIAAHLLSARACHEALGTMDEFRQYMAWLRVAQKRKRNLMKILDQNGL
jgi:hypothetical protein